MTTKKRRQAAKRQRRHREKIKNAPEALEAYRAAKALTMRKSRQRKRESGEEPDSGGERFYTDSLETTKELPQPVAGNVGRDLSYESFTLEQVADIEQAARELKASGEDMRAETMHLIMKRLLDKPYWRVNQVNLLLQAIVAVLESWQDRAESDPHFNQELREALD